MSVSAKSNPVLWIIGGLVALMAIFVFFQSDDNGLGEVGMEEGVHQAPSPDADTPAETIRTLTARVAEMNSQVGALRKENKQLLRRSEEIKSDVTARIRNELRADQANLDRRDDGVMNSLTHRIDVLAAQLDTLSTSGNTQGAGDIPVGLGYDGGIDTGQPAGIWVEPLDLTTEDPTSNDRTTHTLLGNRSTVPAMDLLDTKLPDITPKPKNPVYTLPRNATLVGSVAWTALVGRIPIKGVVQDPMKFKVIVGHENLAANGIRIPGVDGMVFSGTATGDWTLSCVSGKVDSVTFVFDDGTINTVSGDNRSSQGNQQESLGWISDQRGYPCVSGTRVTNANPFLAGRVGLLAMKAAAEAAATAEITTSVAEQTGTATSNVTGDVGTYTLGKAISGGSAEIAQWLEARQSQSFDVVYAEPGVKIAIHLDREIPIDHDPQGRRVFYANQTDPHPTARLD
ncbi:TIGR03752 family integrating conjugative element protein [bacterium endosymbiont of Escarpia laminata]|nr:MAG: TIGR03752 family integrating conjugative element protein [bacterium endosymbiont of Escarpia laminata]